MKLIDQYWEFETEPDGQALLDEIELAGRTCYKSEGRITEDSAREFVAKMIRSGHHAMIEFAVMPTVRVITNRGVTHEIVRHRLFSFAQESTRYCDYSGEMLFIKPVWTDAMKNSSFLDALHIAATAYRALRHEGWPPQQAREVLPNALKTEICIKGNVREWRHFFTLRCSKHAHPQMRALARDMLEGFRLNVPVIFDDITWED